MAGKWRSGLLLHVKHDQICGARVSAQKHATDTLAVRFVSTTMDDDDVPSRQLVREAQPALKALETKLEELRAAVAELENEIAQKKAWGAPIRMLP